MMAALYCEKSPDGRHLWAAYTVGGYCKCVRCGEIGCVSVRMDEDWVQNEEAQSSG